MGGRDGGRGAIQDFTDRAGQGLELERFLDEDGFVLLHVLLQHAVLRVAGHEDLADAREPAGEPVGQFAPAHAGHDQVRDQHLDLRPVDLREAERRHAVLGLDDAIALAFEGRGHGPPDAFLVLGQQHQFVPALRARRGGVRGRVRPASRRRPAGRS